MHKQPTIVCKMQLHHPVPGGVGPLTIVSLLKNTLKAAKGEVYAK